ncbi:MAG: helix-turn-helix domain-containing protein [Pseudonocardiaceae bacterium]
MDEATTLGSRVRVARGGRQLSLRQAAGLAGLSPSVWGQVERGERAVGNRRTLEAMAAVLRVHPIELTGQPWAPRDVVSSEAHAGLIAMETALERYDLGVDPEISVRDWPGITADLENLAKLMHWSADYAAQGELAPALLGELHGAYVRLPQHRREVLLGLMTAYSSVMWTTKRLGVRGLPSLAARAVRQCAEALEDPVWLGYAAYLRGDATGQLDRAAQYRRSVTAAQALTGQLNDGEAVQACGMLQLSAALAAAAQADPDTAATHLREASALAARMDTEVGTWAHLWFGATNVGIWKTSLAVELSEHGHAVRAATAVHPELLPGTSRQAEFWADLGRALIVGKKTQEKGVRVLLHAEQLAPQRIRHDVFIRETIADLLRQARRDAGGRELRGLAWRMGVTPIG